MTGAFGFGAAGTSPPDIRVQDHGTLYLLFPASEAGYRWLRAHTAADATWWGRALVVELRFEVNDPELEVVGRALERSHARREHRSRKRVVVTRELHPHVFEDHAVGAEENAHAHEAVAVERLVSVVAGHCREQLLEAGVAVGVELLQPDDVRLLASDDRLRRGHGGQGGSEEQ